MMVGIDEQKRDIAGRRPVFELPACTVYRGRSGLTFTGRLDADPCGPLDRRHLNAQNRAYLAGELSANGERVQRQLAVIEAQLGGLSGQCLLDVGVGAGELMVRAAARGARVEGLEPQDTYLAYARERGLTVHRATPELHARDAARLGRHDAITLWDVLEHVNYPDQTLEACAKLLRPGGVLLLDTPCRDGAFHRAAELGYVASGGRFTRLLELLYGGHEYGHKQILSSAEVSAALRRAGLLLSRLETFHELALPHRSYLRRLTGSPSAARVLAPITRVALGALAPHNKVLAIAHKPHS